MRFSSSFEMILFLSLLLMRILPSSAFNEDLWKKYSQDFVTCPSEVIKRYGEVFEGKGQKSQQWCQETMKKYGTVIGKRWYILLFSPL